MRPEDIISVLYIASLQGSTMDIFSQCWSTQDIIADYLQIDSTRDDLAVLILFLIWFHLLFTVLQLSTIMSLCIYCSFVIVGALCCFCLPFAEEGLSALNTPRYCEKTLHWSNSRHFNVHKWRKDIYLQTDYREFRYPLDNVDTAMGRSWDGLMTRDCNHRCAGQSYPCFSRFKLQRPRQRR